MLTNQNSGAIIKSIQKRLNNNKKESDEKGFWQRKKGFSGKMLFVNILFHMLVRWRVWKFRKGGLIHWTM